MAVDIERLKPMARAKGMEFDIGKVGRAGSPVTDLNHSTKFFKVLGFKVSDIYPEAKVAIDMHLPR